MVIPVRNATLCAIVLLLGIAPLWGLAAEQETPVVEQGAASGEEAIEQEGIEQQSYGPIVPNDTLAEIAIKIKGDSPWHYHRWMYALYLKNPEAFFGDNMNNLKMGAKLNIPTEAELEQIDLGEAFRAVKVHFYVLQQERQEKQESNEDLLLRARLQRLFSSNEMMQKESGELFERIAALEQQMGSVVDKVLESEGETAAPAPVTQGRVPVAAPASQPQTPAAAAIRSAQPDPEKEEGSLGWFYLLLLVALLYSAGFLWRRRIESTL